MFPNCHHTEKVSSTLTCVIVTYAFKTIIAPKGCPRPVGEQRVRGQATAGVSHPAMRSDPAAHRPLPADRALIKTVIQTLTRGQATAQPSPAALRSDPAMHRSLPASRTLIKTDTPTGTQTTSNAT